MKKQLTLSKFKSKEAAFTLIELLVVVAIIGVLATIVLASLGTARERAQIAKTIAEIRSLENEISLYVLDTGVFPANCSSSCTAATDPFLNALGVSGWNGPYGSGVYDRAHPWGGHFGFRGGVDPGNQNWIWLDDDTPGNSTDNGGLIPVNVLTALDEKLDDGDISTGDFLANDNALFISPGAGKLVFDTIE